MELEWIETSTEQNETKWNRKESERKDKTNTEQKFNLKIFFLIKT